MYEVHHNKDVNNIAESDFTLINIIEHLILPICGTDSYDINLRVVT